MFRLPNRRCPLPVPERDLPVRVLAALLSVLCALLCSTAWADPAALLTPSGEKIEVVQTGFRRPPDVVQLSCSEDGKWLATLHRSGAVCIWSLDRTMRRDCLPSAAQSKARAIAFAPKHAYLAVGYADGHIDLRPADALNSKESCASGAPPEPLAYGRVIQSLVFSSDGETLAAMGSQRGTERTWDNLWRNGRCVSAAAWRSRPLAGPPGAATLWVQAALSGSARYGAAYDQDLSGWTAIVWDAQDGRIIWRRQGTGPALRYVTLAPQGTRLALWFASGTLELIDWSANTSTSLATGPGDPGDIYQKRRVAFSPDGRQLVVGTTDGRVTLWDAHSGALVREHQSKDEVTAVAFQANPLGQATAVAFATPSQGVSLWDLKQDQVTSVLEGTTTHVSALAYNPQGTLLATVSEDRAVRIWEHSPQPEPRWRLRCQSPPTSFAPMGSTIAFRPPSGDQLAVAVESRTIRLFDSKKCLPIPRGDLSTDVDDHWLVLAYSGDGRILAGGSAHGAISVYDVDQGRRIQFIPPFADAVLALAFDPTNSDRLVSTSNTGTIRVWQSSSGRLQAELHTRGGQIPSVSLSSDGKILAAAANGIELWDLSARHRVAVLPESNGAVFVEFSADDRTITSLHRDGNLRSWVLSTRRLRSRSEIPSLRDLQYPQAVAMHPSNGSIATGLLGQIHIVAPETALANREILLQADANWGYWSNRHGSGTLYRHDTGGLLWTVEHDGGPRIPLPPPPPAVPPSLTLSLALTPGSGFDLGSAQIVLTNTQAQSPAAWIDWQDAGSLGTQNGPAAALSSLPGRLMNLSHESPYRSDPIPIARRGRLPWPWERLTLCVVARPYHGQQASVCAPVRYGLMWWLAWAGTAVVVLLCVGPLPLVIRGLPARWRRRRSQSDENYLVHYAESIMARVPRPLRSTSPVHDVTVSAIVLPPLRIAVPAETLAIVCSGRKTLPQVAMSRCLPADLHTTLFALLLDRTRTGQRPEDILQALRDVHPATLFVILSQARVEESIALQNPERAKVLLREAIIQQCEVDQILPYRDGGNGISDEEESFFFGRQRELEQLLDRHRHNFLLVGPRQMGKSSLLNALSRSLRRRQPQVQVLKYQFWNGSLQTISKSDPSLRADTPEAFYRSVMERSQAHQVFLLDEVDDFIRQERQTQYAFCNVMRALSGQERASFVLAGHQELHDAMRTPDHPLRNFGDLLRLEPLDADSACRMVVEPLTALGLHFVDPAAALDWLLRQTACRPHLLAQVCAALVRWKRPLNTQPISAADLAATALSPSLLHDAFGDWDATEGNALLNGTVLRAALLLGPTTLHDLETFLHAQGAHLTAAEIERSVSQLYSRHYALVSDPAGTLSCPLPMFEYYLTNPQPDGARGGRWGSAEERLRDQLARDIAAVQRWRGEGRV